jgi:hypothetical protein
MSLREKLIREFLGACQWQYKKQLPDMLWRVWLNSFDDIHLDRLEQAMCVFLARSTFFPQPADVRDIAQDIAPSAAEIAECAERQERARQKLLSQIDWEPKQLRSTTEAFLERVNPTQTPADLPNPDTHTPEEIWRQQQGIFRRRATEEELQERARQLKEQFLAKNARNAAAPFPGLPELRLPKSNIAELEDFGGETEGLG